MSTNTVRFERHGALGRLVLDRPPLNVLDIAMLERLVEALEEARQSSWLKLLVVSGSGRCFSAGADVADHVADRVERMLGAFHGAVRRMRSLEVPVVAAVHGAALGGGCELALACDIVVARDDATFGQPEIRLAVFPPVAAALLPRLVGRQRALDVVLTGRNLTAAECLAAGLVSRVWPKDSWEKELEGFLGGMASLSAPVLRIAKRAVLEAEALPFYEALEHAERLYLDDMMALRDPHEGLAAFLEKRQPVWQEA